MRRLAGFVAAAGLAVSVTACGQTDAGITSAVKSKMAADATVKAYEVNVDTQNKVVTLSGDVSTSTAKQRAVALARDTDGVRDVIDRMTVTETAATSGDLDDRPGAVDIDVHDDTAAAGHSVKKGAHRVKEHSAEAAKDSGNAVEHAGKVTADAAKKAGKATAKTAKTVGEKVKDAVTDDNPDSDHDGK